MNEFKKNILNTIQYVRKKNLRRYSRFHDQNQLNLLLLSSLGNSHPEVSEGFSSSIMNGTDLLNFGPQNILYNVGIDQPREFNYKAIAAYCNATIVSSDSIENPFILRAISGHCLILLNSRYPVDEQKYYCMYALAEWIRYWAKNPKKIHELHLEGEDSMMKSYYLRSSQFSRRKEAIKFLVPRNYFLRDIENLAPNLTNIQSLSENYGLNNFLISYAYILHSKRKAILVCLDQTGRENVWYQPSSSLKLKSELKIREKLGEAKSFDQLVKKTRKLVEKNIFPLEKFYSTEFHGENKRISLFYI